jgi:hydroxyacylglutathione hydrolase
VRALNARGAAIASRAPLPFLREIAPDVVRIDPRPPHVFGAGHRKRALNVVGNDSFAVRVGATVPFGAPLVILTVDPDQAQRLRAQLSLVGYDDVRGYASPDPLPSEETLRIEQVDARAAAARAAEGALLLDVRERSEWDAGHVPGAMHVPYEQIRERARDLPSGPIVTYCASGVRSSLAASVLESEGRTVANMRGGFTAWRNADLPTSREK